MASACGGDQLRRSKKLQRCTSAYTCWPCFMIQAPLSLPRTHACFGTTANESPAFSGCKPSWRSRGTNEDTVRSAHARAAGRPDTAGGPVPPARPHPPVLPSARAWLQSSQPSWVVLVNRGTGVQPSARPWSVWFHPTGMSACVASDQGIVGLEPTWRGKRDVRGCACAPEPATRRGAGEHSGKASLG
jgi:hypothetical protein